MIARGRRLCRLTSSIRVVQFLRTISSKSPDSSRIGLCPEIVQPVVSACPSDTIALSFFLWCARQPNYFHDSSSFDRMIPVVCRLTDRFQSVSGIVRELESVGCWIKAQTFMILIRIYWRGDFHGHALEAFDEMIKRNYVPNTYARNMVLDILFKTGNPDVAMEFFRDTKFPNFLSYNVVLSNHCRSSDWVRTRDILREMVEKGFELNTWTLTMVLDCFCKNKRFMELLQVLAFIVVSGKQLTVAIWTILIDSLCQAGEVDRASMFLVKMVEHRCLPTVATYTCLMRGLIEAQNFDEVSVLLGTMISNKCSPDLVFYNVLIGCFSKLRRYEDAIEVFLSLRDSRLKPDAYTLSSLKSTLDSYGKLFLPKLIAELDVSGDLVAYNTLMNALCKAGLPSQAIKVFVEMVNRGFSPDNYSYAALLNGLFMLGSIENALNFYHSIANNPDTDAYVHTIILTQLVKRKQYHMAIKLFRNASLENYRLDVVSYTIAISALLKGCRYEEAWTLFYQMKNSGVLPNMCTYNVMLDGFCKARDAGAVKQVLRDMETAGYDIDHISFNNIIHLLIKLHRPHSALLLCRRMYDLGMSPNRKNSLLLGDFVEISDGKADDPFLKLVYNSKSPDYIGSSSSDFQNELLVCSAN